MMLSFSIPGSHHLMQQIIQSPRVSLQSNEVSIFSKKTFVPDIGMEFRSDKEAHGFFNFYAYLVGFSIVITHHYKKHDCDTVISARRIVGAAI